MIIETTDPGVDGVREAVGRYFGLFPDFTDALKLYGAVMEAQQAALEAMTCDMEPLDEMDSEARLLTGESLIDPRELLIDAPAYRELLERICAAVAENSPGGLPYQAELVAWEGLSDDALPRTRDYLLAGEELGFKAGDKLSDEDAELARNILWEGLAPFYRVCGSMLSTKLEQSLWQRGYCPICGSAPLMGQYRNGDGLWIVECTLCHSGWNVQRAACPFCNESQGSLDYLYLEEDPSRRANYCKVCKRYIKTVDMRNNEAQVMLPFEDIVTMKLDVAAKEEGLIPASGA